MWGDVETEANSSSHMASHSKHIQSEYFMRICDACGGDSNDTRSEPMFMTKIPFLTLILWNGVNRMCYTSTNHWITYLEHRMFGNLVKLWKLFKMYGHKRVRLNPLIYYIFRCRTVQRIYIYICNSLQWRKGIINFLNCKLMLRLISFLEKHLNYNYFTLILSL